MSGADARRLARRGNKYSARRTWSPLCGRTFDSKAEAERGEFLALREKAGQIKRLQYQVRMVLSEKPRVTITLDFAYSEDGLAVYEDVKGVLTRDFRTKLAWLKQLYGVEVRLIGKEVQR